MNAQVITAIGVAKLSSLQEISRCSRKAARGGNHKIILDALDDVFKDVGSVNDAIDYFLK
jgi:hypothetical protein